MYFEQLLPARRARNSWFAWWIERYCLSALSLSASSHVG